MKFIIFSEIFNKIKLNHENNLITMQIKYKLNNIDNVKPNKRKYCKFKNENLIYNLIN